MSVDGPKEVLAAACGTTQADDAEPPRGLAQRLGPVRGSSPLYYFLDSRLLAGGAWSTSGASAWGLNGDLIRVGPAGPVQGLCRACAGPVQGLEVEWPDEDETPGPQVRLGDTEETVAAGLEQCLLGSSLLMPVTSGSV
ncbi:hypothetical protein NDU88_006423 [Pleurodeles waltl]|uniref:Uncharacterized protein n=1 Tax=Pleurodeles waltl TaxID=8319 RepID=A0AAV7QKQ6_PLEWA|nr:hypothetical protein NDU88_006423 [Pleurodeles waltl]